MTNPFEQFPNHWSRELSQARSRLATGEHLNINSRGPASDAALEFLSQLFPNLLPRSLAACLSVTDGFELSISKRHADAVDMYGREALQIFDAEKIVRETENFRTFFTDNYIPGETDHFSPKNLEKIAIIGRIYYGDCYLGLDLDSTSPDFPVIEAYLADGTWLKNINSEIIADDFHDFFCKVMKNLAATTTIPYW